jgi:putative ABC transport system permease protein
VIVRAAFRDLQWRRRRVLIAVVGTSLVFAITLLLTGLSNGFEVEADRLIHDLDADTWAVQKGAAGPFLGQVPFPAGTLDDVRAVNGVRRAEPMVFGRKSVGRDSPKEVNVFGATGRGLLRPELDSGRHPRARGEIVISSQLGYRVGEEIVLSGKRFDVVGRVNAWTAVAGVPNVMVSLEDAQEVVFAGMPIVSAIAVYGDPQAPPDGIEFIDNATAKDDLLRPLGNGTSAIKMVAFLLWIVAAAIVGSVIYVSTLERARDFAVRKATGTSSLSIVGDLACQAIVLSIAAAAVGVVLSTVIAPKFPLPVVVPSTAYVLLPGAAVLVGVIASGFGLRRAVTIDPALAFGSA